MGRGLISVVAPVAAVTGAVVPVVYALARGERPGPVALIGLVVAFVAVAVVSLAPSEQHADAAVVDGVVIALALASGVLFGLFYISFSRVSEDAGLWPVAIERGAATVVLVLARSSSRAGRRGRAPDAPARSSRSRCSRSPRTCHCCSRCSGARRGGVRRRLALPGHDRAARGLRAAGAALAAPVRRGRAARSSPSCSSRPAEARSANDESVAGRRPRGAGASCRPGQTRRSVPSARVCRTPPTGPSRSRQPLQPVCARPLPGRIVPHSVVIEPRAADLRERCREAAHRELRVPAPRLETALPAVGAGSSR